MKEKIKNWFFEEIPREENEDDNIIKDFITIMFFGSFMITVSGIIKEGIQYPFILSSFIAAVISGTILLILNIKNGIR
jgi:ABC-type enterochelin transport system permease subunit